MHSLPVRKSEERCGRGVIASKTPVGITEGIMYLLKVSSEGARRGRRKERLHATALSRCHSYVVGGGEPHGTSPVPKIWRCSLESLCGRNYWAPILAAGGFSLLVGRSGRLSLTTNMVSAADALDPAGMHGSERDAFTT